MDPSVASAALRAAGIEVDVVLEEREHRVMARLPGDRIAWWPTNEEGRRRLETERRVLRLLEARCSFRAPRVLVDDPDVRAMVPGIADPWRVYDRIHADAALARRTGRAMGELLVEQHTRVLAGDVAGWLPTVPSWPEPTPIVRSGIDRIVTDPDLRAAIHAALDRYEAVAVAEPDKVLVHGDFGFHNLGIDADDLGVHGIFDWFGASWGDRHVDLRYLVFDSDHEELLEAALAVYEPGVGRTVDRGRILLYNAASCFSFLGTRPDDPDADWCGRNLAQDLRWARTALARLV